MKIIFVAVLVSLMATIAWSNEDIVVDPQASHHSFPHFGTLQKIVLA
jgi:hypothetical protein